MVAVRCGAVVDYDVCVMLLGDNGTERDECVVYNVHHQHTHTSVEASCAFETMSKDVEHAYNKRRFRNLSSFNVFGLPFPGRKAEHIEHLRWSSGLRRLTRGLSSKEVDGSNLSWGIYNFVLQLGGNSVSARKPVK